MNTNHRLKALDGLRALCIIAVILFHYFSRFTKEFKSPDYYPYHDVYWNVFRYGNLGVHCFFVISGFAIYMTLEKTAGLREFFLKRFIRLWPTLAICTVITFAVLKLFPTNGFSVNAAYFLPSLTITDPTLWAKALKFKDIFYIDGVEWSLVCEVLFYLVAGILYFTRKSQFYTSWLIYSMLVIAANLITELFKIPHGDVIDAYLYPRFLVFFSLGMYFYNIREKRKMGIGIHIATAICLVYQLIKVQTLNESIILLAFLILFALFVYDRLNVLSSSFFTHIGLISYTIYLIHENIGIVLINKLSQLLNTSSPFILIPVTLVVIWLMSLLIERLVKETITPFFKAKAKVKMNIN